MEEKLRQLDEFIKEKSNISVPNTKKSIKLLWEIYNETNDMKLLCENLYNASHKLAATFIETYYLVFNEGSRQNFINSFIDFLNNTKVKEENLKVGFNVVAMVVNLKVVDRSSLKLLQEIIAIAEIRGKFAISKCKTLNSYLLAKTEGNILTIDYSSWSRKELEKFNEFLLETYRQLGTKFKYKDKLEKWLEKYNFAPLLGIEEQVDPVKKSNSTDININEFEDLFEKMFDNKINGLMAEIATTKNELQKFNQSIFAKNDLLELYAEKLQVKEQELFAIKKMLMEQEKVIAELQVAKSKVNKNDNQYKAEIEDLTIRLKESIHMNNISKNQELLALKQDLGTALKLRYDKFNENQDAVCNEDNYEVLRASIHQIFRVLKRYGIEL